jgi:prepilin-type N-terminal cleavage/methylation domain-containing protein
MKKNKAFTLIEIIIAITLVTVVITAVAGLILTTLLANQRNLHSLQATYLAQESLEAVRYMRDSNWLQNYSWDGGQDEWGADFDVSSGEVELKLADEDCPPCYSFTPYEDEAIVSSANGTEYLRELTFAPVLDENGDAVENAVEVTATVTWLERGVTRSIELSTYLTDWQ